MTKSEWLACVDPAAMLRVLTDRPQQAASGHERNPLHPSDHKLRLFACAVARANGRDPESIARVEACVEAGQPNHNFNDREAIDRGRFWKRGRSEDAARGAAHAYPGASTASLLRDIIGNPWWPVKLPPCSRCGGEGLVDVPDGYVVPHQADCPGCGGTGHACATPQVLDLAHAAYQERPGLVCRWCRGKGDYEGRGMRPGRKPCSNCHGTGRIEDGFLDPQRLAVLRDALLDVGCEEAEILDHLDSLGSHVRGCHILDLLLGKE